MALSMPRPTALANGVYHFNVRIPRDLAARVKGTVINLPNRAWFGGCSPF